MDIVSSESFTRYELQALLAAYFVDEHMEMTFSWFLNRWFLIRIAHFQILKYFKVTYLKPPVTLHKYQKLDQPNRTKQKM
jgi:hypothetical protein